MDSGFYESGYRGALKAQSTLGVAFDFTERVGVDAAALAAASEQAAASKPEMILVHGGSSDKAVVAMAPRFPATKFLSTHGTEAGPNFSSFNIRQPQSAFLAGALSAMLTRTGIVGHLSGIRIPPGLHARAAWAQGVTHVDPAVRIVTSFCGAQDDNALSKRATLAEIDQGIDYIYTMLNFGRQGAIDACRERGVKQIGNVIDWCAVHPDVFIASAVANNGQLVYKWVEDVLAGKLAEGEVRSLGMEDENAVRLSMGADVPADVQERIEKLAASVRDGVITLQTEYTGTEFATA